MKSGDLISRSELKKAVNDFFDNHFKGLVSNELITYAKAVDNAIDNAPTVELDESVIQEVLNKRCMTAVTNEYLVALHGGRPHGEWQVKDNLREGYYICSNCGEISCCKGNFCCDCGAEMKGGAE